jgi:hypothetical protein
MVFNLVINTNNNISTTNNQYKYSFPKGGFEIYGNEKNEEEQAQICISSATIPYSWYSINSGLYGNNTLSYIWGGTLNSWTGLGFISSNNILTIAYFSGGGTPAINDTISGSGIPNNTYISSITSSGSNYGVYTISQSATNSTASTATIYLLVSPNIYSATTFTTTNCLVSASFTNTYNAIKTVGTNGNYTVQNSFTPAPLSKYFLIGTNTSIAFIYPSTGFSNYYFDTNGTGISGSVIPSTSGFVYNISPTLGSTTTSSSAQFVVTYPVIVSNTLNYITFSGSYGQPVYIDLVPINGVYPYGIYGTGALNSTNHTFALTTLSGCQAVSNINTTPTLTNQTYFPANSNSFYVPTANVSGFPVNSYVSGSVIPFIQSFISSANSGTGLITLANIVFPITYSTYTSPYAYISNAGGGVGAYTATLTFITGATMYSTPAYITGTGIYSQTTSTATTGVSYTITTATGGWTNSGTGNFLSYSPTTSSLVLYTNTNVNLMWSGTGIAEGSTTLTSVSTNQLTFTYGSATISSNTSSTGIVWTYGGNYYVAQRANQGINIFTVSTLTPASSATYIPSATSVANRTYQVSYLTTPTTSTGIITANTNGGCQFYSPLANTYILQIGTVASTPTSVVSSAQFTSIKALPALSFLYYGLTSEGGFGFQSSTVNSAGSTYTTSIQASLNVSNITGTQVGANFTTTTVTTTTGTTFVAGNYLGINVGDFISVTSGSAYPAYYNSSIQVVLVSPVAITTNYSIAWGAGTKNISFYKPINLFNAYTSANEASFTNYQGQSNTYFTPLTSILSYRGYTDASVYTPIASSLYFYGFGSSNIYPPVSATYYNNTYNTYGSFNTISIADGNYSVSQLNSVIQTYMVSQNQYLTQTSTGQNLYYISLNTAPQFYQDYFTLNPIPSTLPSGYTAPTGFPYSANGYTCSIVIPANSKQGYSFGQIIGFSSGTYPSSPQTTIQNIYSNIVSNLPVSAIVIRCNMISNGCATPDDILDVIPIANNSFGTDIVYEPAFQKWIALKNGMYDNFFIYFQDQKYNTIQVLDSNVVISLLIKQGKRQQKIVIDTSKKEQPIRQIQPLISNDIIYND